MKALISPQEIFTHMYVTNWTYVQDEPGTGGMRKVFSPTIETIENCIRVCDVEENEFEVADPFFWVDCSDDCTRDNSYYKDGVVHLKPQSLPYPDDSIS